MFHVGICIYDKRKTRIFIISIYSLIGTVQVFIHSPDDISMTTTSSFLFDVEGAMSFGLSVQTTRISDELRYTSLQLRKCRLESGSATPRHTPYGGFPVLHSRIYIKTPMCKDLSIKGIHTQCDDAAMWQGPCSECINWCNDTITSFLILIFNSIYCPLQLSLIFTNLSSQRFL